VSLRRNRALWCRSDTSSTEHPGLRTGITIDPFWFRNVQLRLERLNGDVESEVPFTARVPPAGPASTLTHQEHTASSRNIITSDGIKRKKSAHTSCMTDREPSYTSLSTAPGDHDHLRSSNFLDYKFVRLLRVSMHMQTMFGCKSAVPIPKQQRARSRDAYDLEQHFYI
jgi:hypothetical protein